MRTIYNPLSVFCAGTLFLMFGTCLLGNAQTVPTDTPENLGLLGYGVGIFLSQVDNYWNENLISKFRVLVYQAIDD